MRRSVLAVDRVVVLLLGLVLLVAGVAALGWRTGFLADLWADAPTRLNVDTGRVTQSSAYPWVLGAIGVVLVALGLWWLLAHLPRRGVGPLRLPGARRPGLLSVDAGPAVATAAEVLAEQPAVESARGSVLEDRGELVVRLRATVEPGADLAGVVSSCELVLAELHGVLATDQLRSRVELRVRRRAKAAPRVR